MAAKKTCLPVVNPVEECQVNMIRPYGDVYLGVGFCFSTSFSFSNVTRLLTAKKVFFSLSLFSALNYNVLNDIFTELHTMNIA